MKKLTVAAVQAKSVATSFAHMWQGADVNHALELIDQAAAKRADVICFPECYPLVGETQLRAKAKQHGIHLIAGLADGTPARWYITSVIISARGEVIGRQTKNYLTAGEVDKGAVPGDKYEVFETEIGRFGIVICADFAFFTEGVDKSRQDEADIIFVPAHWFALPESFAFIVSGRHFEYPLPIVGVNLARPDHIRDDLPFPRAGGSSTVCVPPAASNLEELWEWLRNKPAGTSDFIHTAGPDEEIVIVDIDIDAARKFPGYMSRRVSEPPRTLKSA